VADYYEPVRRGGLAVAFYPALQFGADPDKEHCGKLGEKPRRYCTKNWRIID